MMLTIIIISTSTNNRIKLNDEVGMVGSKSIQKKFVGVITITIHPYTCTNHRPP